MLKNFKYIRAQNSLKNDRLKKGKRRKNNSTSSDDFLKYNQPRHSGIVCCH